MSLTMHWAMSLTMHWAMSLDALSYALHEMIFSYVIEWV